MARQYMPKILNDPHKNSPAPPPTYLMYCPLIGSVSKDMFKSKSKVCTDSYHDLTDLVNHGMVENAKVLISWERNITSLRNEKFLTCTSNDTFWEVIILKSQTSIALNIRISRVGIKFLRWTLNSNKSNQPLKSFHLF